MIYANNTYTVCDSFKCQFYQTGNKTYLPHRVKLRISERFDMLHLSWVGISHVSIEIKHELLDHYLYVLACLGSCYKYSFTWQEQVRKCVVYLICSVQLINDNCGNIVLVSDDPMSYLYTQRSHRYNFKVKTWLAT